MAPYVAGWTRRVRCSCDLPGMAQMKKTTIWLEPQDWSMIERLARREGLTRSGVIREAVRRLWGELVPQGEWDLKPTWTLQPLWFELWNDRRNGVPASA